METVKPSFYDAFRCLAGSCPDSCCHEWEVDVDENTAEMYWSLPSPLGDKLRRVLRKEEGTYAMTIENRRCPMWRQDGLCEIQAQLGHDALCRTCQAFPRLRHDYGAYVELGLELSCPEAARLIFADYTLISQTQAGGELTCDEVWFRLLAESRKEALRFLETSDMPIGKTLAALLLYACWVQSALDGDALLPPDWERGVQQAEEFAQAGDMGGFYDFFLGLEILTPRWEAKLQARPQNGALDERLRALMKYFICRYWLQAVADGDLTVRVKFMVISCLLVNALGGDMVTNAQLFSKEIENSPENMAAILDAAYSHSAFTDRKLWGLLLKK